MDDWENLSMVASWGQLAFQLCDFDFPLPILSITVCTKFKHVLSVKYLFFSPTFTAIYLPN
jgi:hypothetical protein